MKIIKVRNCLNCPYFLARQTCEFDWCSDKGGYFKATDTIPGWCQLENLTLAVLQDVHDFMELSDEEFE